MTLAVLCGSTGDDLDPAAAARLAEELTAGLIAAGAPVVEAWPGKTFRRSSARSAGSPPTR